MVTKTKKRRVELPAHVVDRAEKFGGYVPVEHVFEAALSIAMDNGTVLRKRMEAMQEIRAAQAAGEAGAKASDHEES